MTEKMPTQAFSNGMALIGIIPVAIVVVSVILVMAGRWTNKNNTTRRLSKKFGPNASGSHHSRQESIPPRPKNWVQRGKASSPKLQKALRIVSSFTRTVSCAVGVLRILVERSRKRRLMGRQHSAALTSSMLVLVQSVDAASNVSVQPEPLVPSLQTLTSRRPYHRRISSASSPVVPLPRTAQVSPCIRYMPLRVIFARRSVPVPANGFTR